MDLRIEGLKMMELTDQQMATIMITNVVILIIGIVIVIKYVKGGDDET